MRYGVCGNVVILRLFRCPQRCALQDSFFMSFVAIYLNSGNLAGRLRGDIFRNGVLRSSKWKYSQLASSHPKHHGTTTSNRLCSSLQIRLTVRERGRIKVSGRENLLSNNKQRDESQNKCNSSLNTRTFRSEIAGLISPGSENVPREPSPDRSRDPSPSSSPDSAPVCLYAGPTRHSQTRRAKRPPACS